MSYKLSVLIVLVFFSVEVRSQNDSQNNPQKNSQADSILWIKKAEYKIDSVDIWTSDLLGNIYIYSNQSINKYDSIGTFKFSQSIKSIGNIESMNIINSMKMVSFSEEQQVACYLDNTLSKSEDCIDLTDKNIDFATLLATSSRPNFLWVYDQGNNQLRFISIVNDKQEQTIENIRGILNSEHIDAMVERNNQLYISIKQKGLYILDMYGSLNKSFLSADIQTFEANENYNYVIENEMLNITQLATGKSISIPMPLPNVSEMRLDANHLYFRNKNTIVKYLLTFSN